AFENVLARSRNDLRHDLHQELVTITYRAAVIRLEHQPTVGRGESAPLIPISFETIAVRVRRSAVNECEHRQVPGFKLSRRIDQHSLDGGAVVSFPLIGLTLRKVALAQNSI